MHAMQATQNTFMNQTCQEVQIFAISVVFSLLSMSTAPCTSLDLAPTAAFHLPDAESRHSVGTGSHAEIST